MTARFEDLNGDEGFSAYRRLIMKSLDTIDRELDSIRDDLQSIKVELLTLKLRAGLWGALAGAVPSLVAALLLYFRGK